MPSKWHQMELPTQKKGESPEEYNRAVDLASKRYTELKRAALSNGLHPSMLPLYSPIKADIMGRSDLSPESKAKVLQMASSMLAGLPFEGAQNMLELSSRGEDVSSVDKIAEALRRKYGVTQPVILDFNRPMEPQVLGAHLQAKDENPHTIYLRRGDIPLVSQAQTLEHEMQHAKESENDTWVKDPKRHFGSSPIGDPDGSVWDSGIARANYIKAVIGPPPGSLPRQADLSAPLNVNPDDPQSVWMHMKARLQGGEDLGILDSGVRVPPSPRP